MVAWSVQGQQMRDLGAAPWFHAGGNARAWLTSQSASSSTTREGARVPRALGPHAAGKAIETQAQGDTRRRARSPATIILDSGVTMLCSSQRRSGRAPYRWSYAWATA